MDKIHLSRDSEKNDDAQGSMFMVWLCLQWRERNWRNDADGWHDAPKLSVGVWLIDCNKSCRASVMTTP